MIELIKVFVGIGKRVLITNILFLFAFVNWVYLPSVFYFLDSRTGALSILSKDMKVSETEYFRVALPSVFLFYLLLNSKRLANLPDIFSFREHKNRANVVFAYFLVILSSAARLLEMSFQIEFFGKFGVLLYPGLVLFQILNIRAKKFVFFWSIFLIILEIIKTAMFTEIFALGFILFGCYSQYFLKRRARKYLFIVFMPIFLVFVQIVKTEYRVRKVADNGDGSASDFVEVAVTSLHTSGDLVSYRSFLPLMIRMNNGFVLSRVIERVPSKVAFAKGETIGRSIYGVLIPRFLWKGKPKTGGADNIQRFLNDTESVKYANSYNLGLLGEGYVNFGAIGVAGYFIILSLFYKRFIFKTFEMGNDSIVNFSFISLLLYPLGGFEKDLFTLLNTIFQSLVLFGACKLVYYFIKDYLSENLLHL